MLCDYCREKITREVYNARLKEVFFYYCSSECRAKFLILGYCGVLRFYKLKQIHYVLIGGKHERSRNRKLIGDK